MLDRRTFMGFAFALAGGVSACAPVLAQDLTPVRFTLDWRIEGPAAGFLLAQERGYFEEEGLAVTIDTGNGSVEAIPRVATGTYDMGFGDINSLIKFLDEDPGQPVEAVMMVTPRRSPSNPSAFPCASPCWPRARSTRCSASRSRSFST